MDDHKGWSEAGAPNRHDGNAVLRTLTVRMFAKLRSKSCAERLSFEKSISR